MRVRACWNTVSAACRCVAVVSLPARTAFDLGRHLKRGQAIAGRRQLKAGLRPTTQMPVYDEGGQYVRTIDMVGAEYDGDQHRTSRPQYIKDQRVWPKLAALGWPVARGWRP